MRLAFSNAEAARSAVSVFEDFGYRAVQLGPDVITDCPVLLGVPAIERRVGLAELERVDLSGKSLGWLPANDSKRTGLSAALAIR
jgi:hypothetical protein